MITMLWKELRENTKWAVLAMLGLGLAEFYALNQQQFLGFYVQEAAPLCKSSFLMITTFGCAAVGLVLGLVQILPEQRRDQWAALIHRPVPRATLFRGKAVAGFLLYLSATILPFVACVWYVATPNHFAAPFSPRMIYPGVADICAGAIYYFAALFVGLQRGPWYGTRAFGVLAAVSGSFIVTTGYLPFYVVIEATVYLSLALFAAAWGAMLSNGTLRAQPWLARLAAIAVVFYGVTALGGIGGMILNAFSHQQYYFGDRYIIDSDGRPLKMSIHPDGHNSFADLNGNAVNDPRLAKGLSFQNMINMSSLSSYVGQTHGLDDRARFNYGYRSSETYLISTYERPSGEVWYYLPHERLFAGYNEYNRIRLGALGENGFSPGYQPAEPFRGALMGREYQIGSFVQFKSTVRALDLTQRTDNPIFVQSGVKVFGTVGVSPYDNDPVLRDLGAIALLDRTQIIDKTGKVWTTLSYHYDIDRWGSMEIGMKSSKGPIFLEYRPSAWIPAPQQHAMPSYLEQVDLQGNVMKSYILPPLPEWNFPRTWQQYLSENMETPAFFYGSMIYQKIGSLLGSKRLTGALNNRLGPRWEYTKDIAIRISTLSLILAVATLLWARSGQFSWRRAWAWAGFVLAFNLAGLITFRLIADWPVLVRCPACGRKRLVNEATCVHCGATWPVPVRDGTEILEKTSVLAASPAG